MVVLNYLRWILTKPFELILFTLESIPGTNYNQGKKKELLGQGNNNMFRKWSGWGSNLQSTDY